jgi:hypothetical protein
MSIEAPTLTATGTRWRLARAENVIVRRLLWEMWRLARWFWLGAALIATLVATTIVQFTPITNSVWENAAQWPRWWLFSMAIAIVTNTLPVIVAHGVSRRAALRGVAVAAVLISVIWSGFMTVGHVVERLVYGWLGWPDEMSAPHLFSSGYDAVPMFLEYAVILLAYLVSGCLIGGLYYRIGAIRGTLALPLGLLPVLAVEVLLGTGWYGGFMYDRATEQDQHGLGLTPPPLAVLVLAALAVLALSALVVHLVLRDVPIHGKK